MLRIRGQGFRRHGKVAEAGGKAGDAQDAHRVFGKSRADMAQQFAATALAAMKGSIRLPSAALAMAH